MADQPLAFGTISQNGTYTGGVYAFNGGNRFQISGGVKLTFVNATFTSSSPVTKSCFYVAGGNVVLEFINCTFVGINSTDADGLVYSSSSATGNTLVFKDCIIKDCSSKKFINNMGSNSTLQVIRTTFTGNNCSGAIFNVKDIADNAEGVLLEDVSIDSTNTAPTAYGIDINPNKWDGGTTLKGNVDIAVTTRIRSKDTYPTRISDGAIVNFGTTFAFENLKASEGSDFIITDKDGKPISVTVEPATERVTEETGKTFADVANAIEDVVFGASSSGGTIISSFGTYSASTSHKINGQTNTVTLRGDYYTTGHETSMHNVGYDGKIYGGAGGALWLDGSVSGFRMGTDGRVFGAGKDTVAATGDVAVNIGRLGTSTQIAGRIYAGGQVATAEKDSSIGGVSLFIDADSSVAMGQVMGGASLTGTNTSYAVGGVKTEIRGGLFGGLVGNGSVANSSVAKDVQVSNTGNSVLDIYGGTFNRTVFAGEYGNGNEVTITGDCYLNIYGGVFKSDVVGGCLARDAEASIKTSVRDTYVTVDSSVSEVWFHDNLAVGSYGDGKVGDTSLTLIGSEIHFSAGTSTSIISGADSRYASSDPTTWWTQKEGKDLHKATLNFQNFAGNLDAIINETFTDISLTDGSRVNFTQTARLSLVDNWNLELSSGTGPLLTFGNGGSVDFTDDNLTLAWDDQAQDLGDGLTLVDFGTASLTGVLTDLRNVTLFGETAYKNVENSCWTTDDFILKMGDDNKSLMLVTNTLG